MKKTIKTVIAAVSLSIFFVPMLVSAQPMECKVKSIFVRSTAASDAPVTGGLKEGEKVEALGNEGKWTKIRYYKGKIGYVFSSYLRQVTEKAELAKPEVSAPIVSESKEQQAVQDAATSEPEVSIHDALKTKSGKAPAPERAREIKVAPIASAADMNELRAMNERLLKEMASLRDEMRGNVVCMVKEREAAEAKISSEAKKRTAAEAEVFNLKADIASGGNAKLFALADSAEEFRFLGIPVNIAFDDRRAVIRATAKQADEVAKHLSGVNAEKVQKGDVAYFIVDKKILTF